MTDSEDRNTVDPPSFHPSPRKISEGSPAQADSGLSAGNPADGADGSRQPAVSEPAPPSFVPSSSPSRRISRPSADGIQADGIQPHSFAPDRQPRSQRSASSSSNVVPPAIPPASPSPYRQLPDSSYLGTPGAQGAGAGSGSGSGFNGTPASGSAPRKPRRIGKIIFRVIIALLVILLVYAGWAWFYVNSQLNHKDYLSSAADTKGSTWLILGSDARDGTTGGTADQVPGFRTDTVMVLTKPDSGPASLISIPRDSYVEVDGKGAKINSVAELYGYPKLVTAVEGITGQKIDHVVSVGFGGLQTIVDALGGVELCYDRTVNDEKSGLNWTAGCHTASGTTALAMSRMRYSDPEGDFGRTKRQRMVISAIMKKAASPAVAANPFTLQKVLKSGLSSLTVDQKTSTLTMVRMALAFRSATREGGVTGTVYYSSQNYRPSYRLGSCVRLAEQSNHTLFSKLANGTQPAGTVGGYAAS